jgi:hypothetical protein
MHIDQPALSSWSLLNLWESDPFINLIAQLDLLKAFRELTSFFVARWDSGGRV